MSNFLHGLKMYENTDGGQVLPLQMSSVYGIVGTAEASEAGSEVNEETGKTAFEEMFPLNKPVLVSKNSQIALMHKDSYLRQAIEQAWNEQKTFTVVVRVEGENGGTVDTNTYLTDGEDNQLTDGEENQLVVEEGGESEPGDVDVVANICGDATDKTGIYALKSAKTETGYDPTLIFAETRSDFTDENKLAIATVLKIVATDLLATAIIKADFEGNVDGKNVFLVHNDVKIIRDGKPEAVNPCAAVAGLIAYVDYNEGQWVSPSNHSFKSVVGVDPAVEFNMMDETSEANQYNIEKKAVIVRAGGSFRLWGNLTAAPDDEQKWQFLCVKRLSDLIKKTIQEGILWAIDKGIRKNLVDDVCNSVKGVLNELQTRGAILGGDCWADPEDNSADSVKQGILHFKYKFGPVYPAQTLIFEEIVTDEYIAEIFD